jgi:hypothetical protein
LSNGKISLTDLSNKYFLFRAMVYLFCFVYNSFAVFIQRSFFKIKDKMIEENWKSCFCFLLFYVNDPTWRIKMVWIVKKLSRKMLDENQVTFLYYVELLLHLFCPQSWNLFRFRPFDNRLKIWLPWPRGTNLTSFSFLFLSVCQSTNENKSKMAFGMKFWVKCNHFHSKKQTREIH